MSATGVEAFDGTIQETNLWLKALMKQLGSDDRHQAYMVMRAVLHALRDRIGPDNAVHLAAQLPLLIRGVFYEGWHMAGTPTRERHAAQFLERVAHGLPPGKEIDPRNMTCAVFAVIWERIDPGEVAKVIKLLPKELRDLWPAVARAE